MALLRVNFFSDVLEQGMAMTVLLPQPTEEQVGVSSVRIDGPPPVLYLLHGLSDDDTAWLRFTSLERYAAARGLAVVMPQVHRSFYTDIPRDGGAYWTFLSEELPSVVERFFRVSTAREETFVAGLSMGGFGAMKWALAQPERFAAAASLSGALAVGDLIERGERQELFADVLAGRTLAEAGNDHFAAVDATDPATAPRLYVACGTDDVRLIDGNRRFAAHAADHGLDVTTDFGPGEHEWGYWDARIQDVLDWLDLA
jgi:S-formylglutathione hydrolase FrmB